MRRLALLFAVFALGLVIACGGGSDDGGDDNDNDGGSSSSPTASSSDNDSSSGGGSNDNDGDNDNDNNSSGGGDSDFCSPDELDAIFDSLDFADLSDLETQFGRVADALDDLEDNAPNEIEDDVKTLVRGLRGFIELLEENDFNFLALGAAAENDPRFVFLDSDEFNDASDRVSEYCGIDVDSGSGGLAIPGGGAPSGGGGFSVDLPEDFPAGLIPPDSTVGFAGDVGFGLTVEFTSTATADEVKAYYEAELGDPNFADSESILWTDGERTVSITGTDGDLTITIIIVAAS